MYMFLLPSLLINSSSITAFANEKTENTEDKIKISELERTDKHVVLSIKKDKDIKKIKLPDGNWVTNEIFNYTINKNGSYDFLMENSEGKIKSLNYTITGLRASYLITNNPNVRLRLSSSDLLSGVSSMRFKNEQGGAWSNYEAFKETKDWTLDNTEGLKTVYATFRDVAGNESTEVFDKIILDKSAPEITVFTINNGDRYTKSQNVKLNINAVDTYSEISKLLISNDNVNWTEVPYSTSVDWTLSAGSGQKTVYLKVVDTLGNTSNAKTSSIYLDNVLPTGQIKINNGQSLTNSRNVKLQLNFSDAHSGVKRVSILEKDKVYNFPTVPNSPTEIDWTLSHGATGQVTLEVEDIAGNIYRTNSNVINISTLEISQFRLTNVVNPSINFKPLTWTFPPQEMKAGANISFDMNYSLELDDKTTSTMVGEYYIEIIGDGGYHKVIQAKYDNSILNGFEATATLPNDAPNGAKVYLTSKVTATLTNDTETFTNEAFFPSKTEKALIGTINKNIKQDIIFNEIS